MKSDQIYLFLEKKIPDWVLCVGKANGQVGWGGFRNVKLFEVFEEVKKFRDPSIRKTHDVTKVTYTCVKHVDGCVGTFWRIL